MINTVSNRVKIATLLIVLALLAGVIWLNLSAILHSEEKTPKSYFVDSSQVPTEKFTIFIPEDENQDAVIIPDKPFFNNNIFRYPEKI